MSQNFEIGRYLTAVREAAKVTQATVATGMALSQPHVSRLEAGGDGFDLTHHLSYLSQIPTDAARRAEGLLQATWSHLPRPPLQHPDIDHLVRAEAALTRLYEFLARDDVPQAVAGQAELLVRRIQEFAEYLRSLQHSVTWIGDIGVGKTTAACRQAGLVADPNNAGDLRGVLLDTGGGRVTLCEVSVETGRTYELAVEPVADEEVYRIVADFARALWSLKSQAPDTPPPAVDYRPAEEIERALRNMCDLTRPPRRKGVVTPDPASDLMARFETLEDFKAEIAARLTLWRRTRKAVAFEGTDDRLGRQWLKDTFSAVNNGRHAEFSLPGRMTVSVPFAIFKGTGYDVDLIDTRGVDGSAVRPDIVARLKDRRTVSVLCTRFNSAPDLALQALLQHMIETQVDPTFTSRLVVLALARTGEALAMRDDGGRAAQDVEEGYDIKRGHVEDALGKVGAGGVEVEFFDSTTDDAGSLTETLNARITAVRASQARALDATIAAVDDMLSNVAETQAMMVLAAVNKDIALFAERHRIPPTGKTRIDDRLLTALRTNHPRTVWAATRRKGSFWNFDAYQHLGDGAAATARREAAPAILGLQAILQNRLADPEFATAHSFVNQLLENLSQWEADFIEASRHYAVTVYRADLKGDEDFWDEVESLYGQGMTDYRGEVAAATSRWFDGQAALADKFARRVKRAWRQTFLRPLRQAAGETGDDDAV